jgi:hypothetical protein
MSGYLIVGVVTLIEAEVVTKTDVILCGIVIVVVVVVVKTLQAYAQGEN